MFLRAWLAGTLQTAKMSVSSNLFNHSCCCFHSFRSAYLSHFLFVDFLFFLFCFLTESLRPSEVLSFDSSVFILAKSGSLGSSSCYLSASSFSAAYCSASAYASAIFFSSSNYLASTSAASAALLLVSSSLAMSACIFSNSRRSFSSRALYFTAYNS